MHHPIGPNVQEKLAAFRVSERIRDFTPRGLRNLIEHCGFEVAGRWAQIFGVIARLGSPGRHARRYVGSTVRSDALLDRAAVWPA